MTITLKKQILGIALLLLTMSFSAAADPVNATKSLIDSRHKNQFAFKVGRTMSEANVEVYNSNGMLLAEKKMTARTMTIDFTELKSGTYTVVVRKGRREAVFQYVKK